MAHARRARRVQSVISTNTRTRQRCCTKPCSAGASVHLQKHDHRHSLALTSISTASERSLRAPIATNLWRPATSFHWNTKGREACAAGAPLTSRITSAVAGGAVTEISSDCSSGLRSGSITNRAALLGSTIFKDESLSALDPATAAGHSGENSSGAKLWPAVLAHSA